MSVFSSLTDRQKMMGLAAVGGLCAAPLLGYAVAVSPKILVAGILLSACGLLLLAKPMWAVYGLVIGTSFDSISIRTPIATLGAADLSSLALVPIWIMSRLISTTRFQVPLGLPVLIAFFTLAFVSMLLGVAPSIAYGSYVRLLILGLTVLAVVDLVRSIETMETILVLLAICGLLQALIGLALGVGGSNRVEGLVEQPNLLAAKVAFGLFPMLAWLMRTKRKKHRILLVMAISAMVLCIVLTISRGSYIAVLVGALWWFRRSRRAAVLMIAICSILFAGIGYFSGTQLAQIERRLEFQDSSVVNRATVAKNALTAMKAKPLLGVGFGQFNQLDRVVDITAEKKRGGHSFYLSLAASSGLPACLLFILFALIQWRKMALAVTGWQPSFRQNDEWSDRYRLAWMSALFRALLIYHATSLTIRGSQRLTEWTMLALYCAMACLVVRYRASSNQSGEAWTDTALDSDTVRTAQV